jgi:hypothetical protein
MMACGTRRQRRVAHGDGLVVGEVAGLLILREAVAALPQGHYEVGLLDHLLAVEVEVVEVQEQWVPVGRRVLEVPDLMREEVLVLRMDPERRVVGQRHRVGGASPAVHLFLRDAQLLRTVLQLLTAEGRGVKVPLRHQVGVDVVVGDGRVLVRAGDAVDAKPPGGVEVAEAGPQARGLDQQLEADLAREVLVEGGEPEAVHGAGHVGVDVNAADPAGQ